MFQRFTAGLLGVVLCAAVASAQATMTVPQTINVGEDITIGFDDPSRAGQVITVHIVVATPAFVELEVYVHLDQTGKGSVGWTVPEGLGVTFNASGVREIVRAL